MTRRISCLAGLLLHWTAAPALAINNTALTAQNTALGEVREQSVTGPAFAYYSFVVQPGRSYVALCWRPFLEIGNALNGFCSVEIRSLGDTTTIGSTTFGDLFPAGGNAQSVVSPAGPIVYVRVSVAGTDIIRTVLIETTISTSWYFTSSALGYEGYVTLRNTTTQTVSATVTAYNSSGTVQGSPFTASIPANGNIVVPVAAQFGASGGGSVAVTHNNMPGALVGNLTSLSATTGLSFDAPFTPRMVWSFMSPP